MKNLNYKKNQVTYIIFSLLILFIFAGFMVSCSGANNTELSQNSVSSGQGDQTLQDQDATKSSQSNVIINVSADDVFTMLQDKDKYFLLDVRTQEEYDEGFIENSVLIPVSELESRLSEIPAGKPIIVYCRTGSRSTQAAEILIKNNFGPVYNMLGGITEWQNKGYPVKK